MADAVTSKILVSGSKRIIVHLTNISDGTGESAVVKIDKSTLLGPDGTEPSKLVLEEVSGTVQGFTSVRLLWDHTTDDVGVVLGTGYNYFCFPGGHPDPASSGGTGDIVLTTAGAASGATYDITIVARLKD